ncbi:LarC family nickel insertion protein [Oceanidesulfovibrio indonesiensis]|nr:LarC family nickel insertion protein [Oceanidesulfovibrio indonesiensis]
MRLYLDLSYGIGGDMLLAALADAGLDLHPLAEIFRNAGLTAQLCAAPEMRSGISGKRLFLEQAGDQPLRTMPDIEALLDALPVSDAVRERSRAAFWRLAEAEAAVHGCEVDKIHFHEVGAVDTLADVVGAAWALETLGISEVRASAIPWFTGTVCCAHGELPLPAPAVVKLLDGKPVRPSSFTQEMVTPTGALLLDMLVDTYDDAGSAGPAGRLAASGLGYGARDSGGGLRVFLLEDDGAVRETVWVLESHIDHLSGEDLGRAFEGIFAAGALDVLALHGIMKKSRPAVALRVVCEDAHLTDVEAAFFRETLTLGIRRTRTERTALPRKEATMQTPWGEVRAKEYTLGGQTFIVPEDDDLAEMARRTGQSTAALRRLLMAK